MIVVDTNVVAGLYLPVAWSTDSERLVEADPEWCAPVLWRSELRNILATSLRAGRLHLHDALEIAASAEGLFLNREFSIASPEVLRLAAESGCTAYDCEFVAVARHLAVPLVTLDQQLLTAFASSATTPARFLADA